jgi:hypothetical protein
VPGEPASRLAERAEPVQQPVVGADLAGHPPATDQQDLGGQEGGIDPGDAGEHERQVQGGAEEGGDAGEGTRDEGDADGDELGEGWGEPGGAAEEPEPVLPQSEDRWPFPSRLCGGTDGAEVADMGVTLR